MLQVKAALRDLNQERIEYITDRAQTMYAVYGFVPHAVIVPEHENRDMGIEIQRSHNGMGYVVSEISEDSDAQGTDMVVGDIIIELNGTFLLDVTENDVGAALARGETEAIFVLVRPAPANPTPTSPSAAISACTTASNAGTLVATATAASSNETTCECNADTPTALPDSAPTSRSGSSDSGASSGDNAPVTTESVRAGTPVPPKPYAWQAGAEDASLHASKIATRKQELLYVGLSCG